MEERYQPYTNSSKDGSNALKENSGSGSTEAYRPAGWREWEQQRKEQTKAIKEGR